jgi:hypothetical protein
MEYWSNGKRRMEYRSVGAMEYWEDQRINADDRQNRYWGLCIFKLFY